MKKVSISNIDKILKAVVKQDASTVVDIHGIQVEVQHEISVDEMCNFVFDYLNNVVRDLGDGELTYVAALDKLSFRSCILKYYAKFKTDEIAADKLYALCNSDVYDVVIGHISEVQMNELYYAARDQLGFELRKIENATKFDAVCEALVALINKLSSDSDHIDELANIAKSLSEKDETAIAHAVLKFKKDEKDGDS